MMRIQLPGTCLALATLTLGASASTAQTPDTITYEISFPDPAHHEARVTAVFGGLPPGAPLELRMSRSSPGRYALHEFAKNVYSVDVTDGGGRGLAPTRPDPYGWNVSGHDGTVRVSYTLFGDRGDGTYAGIDREHAHLNIPATFMYGRGLRERPIRVTFRAPAGSGWLVATQLRPTTDPFTFTAPDLDYFMDSPTELAALRFREWTVSTGGVQRTIRLALHDPSDDEAADSYAEMAKLVVAEEGAVFGEFPAFDFGTYTFLACYGPWADGDGMEHRNSTSLTSGRTLAEDARGLLSTLSHEFFHAWNMERIRSAELEPFDYDRANMSDELWLGEGFTQYYTSLFLVRAGVLEPDAYVRQLAGTLNAVVNGPGRRYASAVEMSRMAPFWDAAASIDPTNQANTFISYYTWGAAIGLGLDLTLRTRFGLTLDGFMRAMWEAHGKREIHYTLADIRTVLARYTGDSAFADDFFERNVLGRDVVDYRALFAQLGIVVRPARPGAATAGPAGLQTTPDGVISGTILVGTPLYAAGIADGDVIVSLGGEALTAAEQIEQIAARHQAGETVPVVFTSRGRTLTATLTFAEDPRLEVLTYERAGLEVTEPMRRLRDDWLGSRADR